MHDHVQVRRRALSGFIQPPIVDVHEPLRWEYKQLIRNVAEVHAPTKEELNTLGAEGWEFAGLFMDVPRVYVYFKRPVWCERWDDQPA
jgi:hypothetical protein